MTYEMHNYSGLAVSAADTNANTNANRPTKSSKDNRIEKYSLRQRQKRRIAQTQLDECHSYDSDYGYVEHDQAGSMVLLKTHQRNSPATAAVNSQSVSKPKPKAAPLSKYRRKTANARERTRMREINLAFETLRHCMPQTIIGEESGITNEKLTKITTLRLAMKYIRLLTEVLADPNMEASFLIECTQSGDNRFTSNETAMALSLAQQQMSNDFQSDSGEEKLPLAKKTPGKTKGKQSPKLPTTKPKRTPIKVRQTKRQKLLDAMPSSPFDLNNSVGGYLGSSADSVSSATSAYASLSPNATPPTSHESSTPNFANSCAYLLDNSINSAFAHQSMSDLSSLILESDGESLHLSEHCLSPPLQSTRTVQTQPAQSTAPSEMALVRPTSTRDTLGEIGLATLENPLELSLRLLESPTDSMDYTVDPQPPSCISPLVTLDSFNPFGDLLQSDFPEHNSLDLFLT